MTEIDRGPVLVTEAQATKHLRLTLDATADAGTLEDLADKTAAASLAVRLYLDTANDVTWDPTTVPADVRAAVLLALGGLWADRGDAGDRARTAYEEAWDTIKHLLGRRRLPVTA